MTLTVFYLNLSRSFTGETENVCVRRKHMHTHMRTRINTLNYVISSHDLRQGELEIVISRLMTLTSVYPQRNINWGQYIRNISVTYYMHISFGWNFKATFKNKSAIFLPTILSQARLLKMILINSIQLWKLHWRYTTMKSILLYTWHGLICFYTQQEVPMICRIC